MHIVLKSAVRTCLFSVEIEPKHLEITINPVNGFPLPQTRLSSIDVLLLSKGECTYIHV